jgi:hypothetical protein
MLKTKDTNWKPKTDKTQWQERHEQLGTTLEFHKKHQQIQQSLSSWKYYIPGMPNCQVNS